MLASKSSSGPIRAGSYPAAVMASAKLTPSPSRSARAAAGSAAGQQLAAQAGHAEPGPFLLAERGDGDRPDGDAAAGAQQVDRGEPGHHAERPVERAAVRHRVQVAAGHDGAR